jgi:hypothetical protein
MKLTKLEYEVPVEVSDEKAWEVLARYADVGDFHAVVVQSSSIGDKVQGIGAERYCELPDKVEVWERIYEWNEGESYKYDVYKWKKFPLKKMLTTFGVRKKSTSPQVWIYQAVEYRLSPGILTPIMKGKLRGALREGLIAYKHFMETGEPNADSKALLRRYSNV